MREKMRNALINDDVCEIKNDRTYHMEFLASEQLSLLNLQNLGNTSQEGGKIFQ